MKKEGLVFILFLVLVFLVGCAQNIQVDPFTKFTYTPQTHYYTIPELYADKINPVIATRNIEECDNILTEEISTDNVIATTECSIILTKISAYLEKDYSACGEINYEGTNHYEECIAPIVAYSAISLQDETYCETYLSTPLLIKLCEDDYEIYS